MPAKDFCDSSGNKSKFLTKRSDIQAVIPYYYIPTKRLKEHSDYLNICFSVRNFVLNIILLFLHKQFNNFELCLKI